MKTRNWSIRSKIIALVLVPLSAVLGLWIFATVLTAGPAMKLLSAQTLLDTVGNPGQVLVGELQRERRLSVIFLSDLNGSPDALATQRAATDRAAAEFRRAAGSADAQDAADAGLRSRINRLFVDLDTLTDTRKYVDSRQIDAVGAQSNFNGIINTGFQVFGSSPTLGDDTIDRQIRALITVSRGQEYLSRVDSLLAGANAAGRLDLAVRRELLLSVGTAQFLLADGVTGLSTSERADFQVFSTGAAYGKLQQLQETLVSTSRPGAPSPVTASQWQPAYDQVAQELRTFEVHAGADLADEATPVAVNVLIRLGAAGLLGLIALAVSLIVSIRVGRSLVGRLRRLRAEALEMAGERLPTVVRRLQRGEAVDVNVETPPLEYGRDEIGQVGRAFNKVQRTAVQSAVEEASVRRGINEVFLNIARRSQTLLHRQLSLLDQMERRETEPAELEDLYRVDHLATRMRRHAEDLVILAGAAPGRGWRNPVPVIDVLRGAISEVEDYKRIDIRSIETSAILGRAVGDVIHLLAELLENAASFSPPQTRVVAAGQVLPNGYAIEIEDRGLGMSSEAVDEANRRLREPPDFDPADSARLGLFVVAQLAARQGIKVSLRQSPYAGVTAIVLIPGELVTMVAGPMALPAGPSPADKSWDRPLTGSGTDDPARQSLAALQWQGAEELQWQGADELRSITVSGRPIAANGSAASPATTQELPMSGFGGPSPSAVADGLSVDGLVQRRRSRPRREPRIEAPEQFPTGLESPDALLHRPHTPPAPPPAAAHALEESPTTPVPADDPFTDHSALPGGERADHAPDVESPAPIAPTSEESLAGSEDGLPKRVRQASLAPQLREPAAEPVAAAARSPEQVRSIMSALQWGTNRGRLAAAGLDPAGEPPKPGEANTMADAETVLIPVIRDHDEPRGGGVGIDGAGNAGAKDTLDAAGGTAADDDQPNRPEKDA
jgi:hypothetical protein